MSEIIEYEPKKPKSDLPFWFGVIVFVALALGWVYDRAETTRELAEARAAASPPGKLTRAEKIEIIKAKLLADAIRDAGDSASDEARRTREMLQTEAARRRLQAAAEAQADAWK